MKTTNWESEQLQSCTTAASIFQASRQIKYILLPSFSLLLSKIHTCSEVSFSISQLFLLRKEKIQCFPLTVMGWEVCFILRENYKQDCWDHLDFEMQVFWIYIFSGIYTRVSDIRDFFPIALPVAVKWKWSSVPLLPFLERVPGWAGSLESVTWDCNLGCQGVNREKKETKMRGRKKREEESGIS